jgi:DNA-directed RNA polymerase subunit RPC12/RpoP
MSSDIVTTETTTPKIPKFHFNQMDQKFIDDVIKNIQSKHFPSDGSWFLNNFYYFKTGSKLKIDLGRIVKNMSMPDDKSDLSESLCMSSVHLLSQIQYIIETLVIKLPVMLKPLNWYLTEIQYMSYDPDFIRTNKYTNVSIKGCGACQIIAYIEPIEGCTPICKNPDSPKTEIINDTKPVDIDDFTTVIKKNATKEKKCLTCKKTFEPLQAHYQNCIDCNKKTSTVITSKKCSTCPNVFTPEQAHYHNCPTCFTKMRANNSKPVTTITTKKCSDCSATFKPIQSHYHQCSSCFGKRTK